MLNYTYNLHDFGLLVANVYLYIYIYHSASIQCIMIHYIFCFFNPPCLMLDSQYQKQCPPITSRGRKKKVSMPAMVCNVSILVTGDYPLIYIYVLGTSH